GRAARSAPAVRSTVFRADRRSCSESPPLVLGQRHRRAVCVVVADEHAPRVRDKAVVGPDLVLELEALRADARAAAAHLDLLAGAQLGAEVDLDACEDERLEVAENADPRLLEVRRVDRVVGVTHRVAVPKADVLALDPWKPLGHAAMV